MQKLSVNEGDAAAQTGQQDQQKPEHVAEADAAVAEGTQLTPEERKAKQEAKKKAKAEEKAKKEAKKAAAAAQRGQKAAVLTAPDPSDPHGSHYGDAEMVQSQARTDTKWTRVEDIGKGLVGSTVRRDSAHHVLDRWCPTC